MVLHIEVHARAAIAVGQVRSIITHKAQQRRNPETLPCAIPPQRCSLQSAARHNQLSHAGDVGELHDARRLAYFGL